MKIRDGYWHLKPDVSLMSPVDIRDVRPGNGSFTVYSACRPITRRGDTLNTPMLTTVFSSPMPDVIRVRTYHLKGVPDRAPRFDLPPDRADAFGAHETEDGWTLESGDLSVRIPSAGAANVSFERKGRRLTRISAKHSGYVRKDDGGAFLCEYLALSVGELVYGLGERFSPFVKNGQVVDIWNEDGGTASEQAYKNIPFYMTNRGYGVLVANPGRVSFEVGSEVVTAVQFSVPGELLEYYLLAGDTPKDVLRRYAELAGKPSLPPAWSFGLWLTTSFTTEYDEKTVSGFIDGMFEREIPLSVFHFDCFWMKEFQWVDFEWDPALFPDPAGMLARLKGRGLRICVWINPYVAQKSAMFDEGMEKGYLVKRLDGGVWQWDRWQAGMALVDFTNPEAVAWFGDRLRNLLNMGVDTFKTDFGERIPTDVVWADGSDPVKMHNYYTYLYNRTVFDLLEKERGKNEALVFARSATVGGQKFPVHWGGDCSATYESMAESLRGGLSLALSGFGFWSHDISGFERTATPDLFKRWVAFGMLSSHSRLHGNESYRVPWNFDDESSDVLRFFANLKCSIMPYLYAAACDASSLGIPMMRAMILEFPDDPACSYLDRQYMLGDSLLVAPVFDESGEATYYLPEGVWTSFVTGERAEGGGWRTERHGYMSLPLLVRPNSLIAVGTEVSRPDYDYADGVTFHLFEPADGKAASAVVRDVTGRVELKVVAERTGKTLAITAEGAVKPWNVCLRNIPSAVRITGGIGKTGPAGLIVSAEAGVESVTVALH